MIDKFILHKNKIKDWRVAASIVIFLVATYLLSIFAASFQMSYAQSIQKSNPHDSPLLVMNNTIILRSNSHEYPIKYHITSGRISGIFIERDNTTLLLNLSSASNGTLVVDLPRIVIDSKGPGNADENFTVFKDGQYVTYSEIKTNSESRTIMLSIDNNPSVIEISGTRTVPEFANITLLILATSIACLVVCRLKSNFTSKILKDTHPVD